MGLIVAFQPPTTAAGRNGCVCETTRVTPLHVNQRTDGFHEKISREEKEEGVKEKTANP
jgi:hypothetical protein